MVQIATTCIAIGPDTNDMKVDIQRVRTISCNDGKAIPVPATLLQEHGGRLWLKLRPTSQPINQMVYGKVDKNASFSNHPKFQDFIAKRNQVWAKEETEDQVWDAANEDKPKPSAKKRKREDPEVVSVPLAGVAISCLMQGQRPTKGDVVIQLKKTSWSHFSFFSRTNRRAWTPGSHTRGARQQPKNQSKAQFARLACWR